MGSTLANFEGLIRGAIAAKRAMTPAMRQEVYQSSRNALNRLIESNPALTVQTAIEERKSLEEAINQIEAEFNRFAPAEVSRPDYQSPIKTTRSDAIEQGSTPAVSPRSFDSGSTLTTDQSSPGIPESRVASPLTADSPLASSGQPAPTPEIPLPNETPVIKDSDLVRAVEEATSVPDEDPLAELKEILLEDADPVVKDSLGVTNQEPQPVPEPIVSPDETHIAVTSDREITATSQAVKASAPTISASAADSPAVEALAIDPNTPPEPSTHQPEFQEPQVSEPAVQAEVVAAPTPQEVMQANPEPPIQSTPADAIAYEDKDNMPLEFARRRKKQKLLGWVLGVLVVLALIGWLGYYVYLGIVNGTLFGLYNAQPAQNPNAPTNQAVAADYITIVEPGDLSALITANRGQAELVNELNLEMVRIVSVRDENDRTQAANPILLRLKPGVLEQISGKNVTFEIYAKSGSPSPAQFTVKCQFGQLGSCGRKRFRVGLQPEASIFAFDLGEVTDPDLRAYIAISTDTTAVAATTGRGDVIDIVYARLRANN